MDEIWDNFKLTYRSETHGDETHDASYEAIKPVSVQEMLDYLVKESGEWGTIEIKGTGIKLGYLNGHYVDENRKRVHFRLPPHIKLAVIKNIDFNGGWSLGDYLITIEKRKLKI